MTKVVYQKKGSGGKGRNARVRLLVGAGLLVCAAAAALLWFVSSGESGVDEPRPARVAKARIKHGDGRARDAVQSVLDKNKQKLGDGKSVRKSHKLRPLADEFASFSPADRALAQAVQAAWDADDFEAVVEAADKALGSANPDVREGAVTALGWFGAKALPMLTSLMADPDENVSETAINEWELALSDVNDLDLQVEIATAAMSTVDNRDALEMIVTEITAHDDEIKVINSLIDIMESGNSVGAEIAREEYEGLTGEEWTSVEDAEAWLRENYVPTDEEGERRVAEMKQAEAERAGGELESGSPVDEAEGDE